MEYIVGREAYPTINSALRVAQAGERILILPGIYREIVDVAVPGLVVEAPEGGVTLDGGYSALLFGAAGYKNRRGQQIKAGELPYPSQENQRLGNWVVARDQAAILRLSAPGVWVSGLVVRNVCGRGFAISGDDATLSDCVFDFTYSGTGVIDMCRGATVRGCILTRGSMKYFDPTVDVRGTQTNLIIKKGAVQAVVGNVTAAFGYGEGISADKGSQAAKIESCFVHSFLHWGAGQNEAENAMWVNNVFLTCEDVYPLMGKKSAGDMWVAGNEQEDDIVSAGPFFSGNIIVGDFKEGLAVSNGQSGRPVAFHGGRFLNNTVVGGPNSRYLLTWGTPPTESHADTCAVYNLFLRHPEATGEIGIAWQGSGGANWGPNLSNSPLPEPLRSPDDVVTASPVLVNPFASIRTRSGYDVTSPDLPDVATTFDYRNYLPLPDGEAVRGDGENSICFGALLPPPAENGTDDTPPAHEAIRERLDGIVRLTDEIRVLLDGMSA